MNDDRISRYLHDQAEGIVLAPADPAGAMRRGGRRRARRRAGLLGSVAVLGVVATSVAVYDGGDDQQLQSSLGASASASTYDWSSVTPRSGLGYGGHTAQLADGTVYSISTAPGPYRDNGGDQQFASTLYRSDDGAEWSAASLPSGVRTSDLAGSGDTLYSVGTSPAGGVVLSSSTDGAASWTSLELPDDATAVRDRHVDKITLGSARVAARDGSHLVASMVATTSLDLSLYKPEYPTDRYAAQWDDTGVKVFENPVGSCRELVAKDAAASTAVDVDASGCRAAAEGDPTAKGEGHGEQVASFTYDDLGVTGELREHVGGKAYVYVTDDGHTFTRAELPSELSTSSGWVASPLATSDGYRLVLGGGTGMVGEVPSTTVLRSADGHIWDASATLPGSPGDLGVLGGRAAVSVWGNDGVSTLGVEQTDGTFAVLDLARTFTAPAGGWTSVDSVSFGPLGFAAVVGTSSQEGPYVQYIVHSTDGTSLQVVKVSDVIHNGGMVSGVVVTPDAIVARVTTPGDADDDTPPTQEVLVGTPTG